MQEETSIVRIYYLPRLFPCGPQSACCGPVGQSGDELRQWVSQLRSILGDGEIECIDLSQKTNFRRDLPALRLFITFGAAACPLFTVHGEVVSMGPPTMPELMDLVRHRLRAATPGVTSH